MGRDVSSEVGEAFGEGVLLFELTCNRLGRLSAKKLFLLNIKTAEISLMHYVDMNGQ